MKGQPITLDVVEDWVRDASSRFNHAGVVFDPFQAIGMAQRLVASGVRCEQFNFSPSSIGRLAALMYRQLHDHAFALPDDESLLRELSRVRFRQTAPGLYRMDHDSNGHDDRAVALALAAQWLLGDGNAFAGLPVLAKPSREERNLLADFPMMTEQQLLDMGA
jgi:non-ribosomal peptide synthetase component F